MVTLRNNFEEGDETEKKNTTLFKKRSRRKDIGENLNGS
jgi:hypothetical protein